MSDKRSPVYAFFRELMSEHWSDGCYEISGDWIHERLVKHGLITETIFDPAKHDDPTGVFEAGDPYFVLSKIGLTDPASPSSPESETMKTEGNTKDG